MHVRLIVRERGVLSTLVGPKKMVACDRGQGSLEGVSLCLVLSGALGLEK